MIVGVPVERSSTERRVALVPAALRAFSKAGIGVVVQRGAGAAAGFPDAAYESRGARLVGDWNELLAAADAVVCIGPPAKTAGGPDTAGMRDGLDTAGMHDGLDTAGMRDGQILIGQLDPFRNLPALQQLARQGVTSFALELVPRISRAQSMDVLSSMATVAGYKAVLLAAAALGKMFPMMITAAGTLAPAKVLVVGAGVAGLQAIATARRLGAVVAAYDIRPDVKEQVESLGADFLEVELDTGAAEDGAGYAIQMDEEFYRKQREVMAGAVAANDVVITTAAVPGKQAPILLTEEMVSGMNAGSVIVDLAAETGGNCELTRAGETIEAHGVTIIGPVGLPATVPTHASQMYAKNVSEFVMNLVHDGEAVLDGDDEIIKETMVTHAGQVVNQRVKEMLD